METMQLDLFMHSRDVTLQNDVIRALHERDAARAREALATLEAEFPGCAMLEPAGMLLDILSRAEVQFADHAAVSAGLDDMYATVIPAAHSVLGRQAAGPWLSPLWLSMARAVGGLGFNPRAQNTHAAYLLLQGGELAAAQAAASDIPSWRRIPGPLSWMIEARFRLDGLESVWHLLLELAWIDAPAFDTLVERLNTPALHRLLGDFSNAVDDPGTGKWAWFPAWLLIAFPAMTAVMAQTQTCTNRTPERTARLIADLLMLEKQGRHAELVAKRKHLRDANRSLYAFYMSSR